MQPVSLSRWCMIPTHCMFLHRARTAEASGSRVSKKVGIYYILFYFYAIIFQQSLSSLTYMYIYYRSYCKDVFTLLTTRLKLVFTHGSISPAAHAVSTLFWLPQYVKLHLTHGNPAGETRSDAARLNKLVVVNV